MIQHLFLAFYFYRPQIFLHLAQKDTPIVDKVLET